MKKMMMLCGVTSVTLNLCSNPKTDVETVMYLDTEMPCLQDETLSGKIVIRNNGDNEIKLMKSAVGVDYFVHEQLYIFPNISVQEARTFYAGPERDIGGQPSRSIIKENVDYVVQNMADKYVVTLKKGETLEIDFNDRKIYSSALYFHNPRRQIPFATELYLPPDVWIPVEVHPPIEVAYDAKYISVNWVCS